MCPPTVSMAPAAQYPSAVASAQTAKPKITLDEFFNDVDFPSVQVSPDGNSVIISTNRADCDREIFQTGRQRIAFLSERKPPAGKAAVDDDSKDSTDDVAQICLISPVVKFCDGERSSDQV